MTDTECYCVYMSLQNLALGGGAGKMEQGREAFSFIYIQS